MQTQQTITLFGTLNKTAISRTSKNGRKYTALGFPSSPTGIFKPFTTTS